MKLSLVIETEEETTTVPIEPNARVIIDGVYYVLSTGIAMRNPTGHKPYRDKNWLNAMYIDEELTLKEIADGCGVSPMTINQWLFKHKIPSRPRGRRKE